MVVFALTLIRHGETGANKDNIIQGQMDVPLSSAGYAQADLLGNRLQNQCYTHVFASDLVRAQQTLKTIMEKSHFVKFTVVSDERLRERKFGEVEGKSFGELKKLARLANQTPPNFTPSGAETIQQVRSRAILFFRELCQQLLKKNVGKTAHESDSNSDCFDDSDRSSKESTPAKRRRQHGINNNSPTGNEDSADVSPTLEEAGQAKAKKVPHFSNSEMPSHDRPPIEAIGSDLFARKSAATTPSPVAAQLCVYVPSRRSCRQSQQSSTKKLPTPKVNTSPFPAVSAAYATMDIDCPNVTLFPLGEHKFLNSVADRKTSVDSLTDEICGGCGEPDLRPAANVLVVSHGGLIRELVRHFVEDLGCAVPGGKGQALRLSPNTGLSKFTVSLEKDDEDPKVICLLIHDKDHLVVGQMHASNNIAL